MTTAPDEHDAPDDDRLAEALAEYYARQASGDFDPESFLARYGEIRAELEEFLATVEDIQRIADAPLTGSWAKIDRPRHETAAGVALPTLETPEKIRYFGDYELLEEVARGGMGIVYRARQVSLDRTVAVKMILAGQLASDDDVARFRQEAAAAANLNHPNVVTIYEVGEYEGQHFFSMEFVEGSSLAELVRHNPLSALLVATHVRTIAQAMAAVHAAGILHRDLKPSNVLIDDRTGVVRITDFGLAKQVASDTHFTSTGQVLGTPSYMAPEQASGQNDQVCEASDVYSLGAILYELLTARPPFVGETPWDTAWQVSHADVAPPRVLNPKTPRDLETICLKCLHKDRQRRYATAQELAEDLGRFLRGEPIHARPVGRAERVYRWCRRHPAPTAVLGLLAAGIVSLIAVLAIFGRVQQQHAQDLAETLAVSQARLRDSRMRLAETERDKGLRLCEQGDVDQGCLWLVQSLETAPDDAAALRKSILFNIAAWRRELSTLQAEFPGSRFQLRFSPNNRRLFLSAGQFAHVVAVPSGERLGQPLPLVLHPRARAQFGPDDNSLLLQSAPEFEGVINSGTVLWRYDGERWQEQSLAELPGRKSHYHFAADGQLRVATWNGPHLSLKNGVTGAEITPPISLTWDHTIARVFSPDAKRILSYSPQGNAVLRDLLTGAAVGEPLAHPSRITGAAFSPDSQRVVTGYEEMTATNRYLHQAQVWDANTGARLGRPLLHPDEAGRLERIAFSDDGERLVTAVSSGTLRVWDQEGKPLAPPISHNGHEEPASIDAAARLAAYLSRNREVRLADLDTGRLVGQPLLRASRPHFQLSRDGNFVVAAGQEHARLWTTPSRGLLARPMMHAPQDPQLLVLAFSGDGGHLLSFGYRDMTARLWDARNGRPLGKPITPRVGIAHAAVSRQGRWVVTASLQTQGLPNYQGVMLWDPQTGEALPRKLPHYESRGHWVVFTSDEKRLITAGDAAVIHVYDLQRDEVVLGPWEHPDHELLTTSKRTVLVLSPDERWLASWLAYQETVALWDLEAGNDQKPRLIVHPRGIAAVAFSPDSQRLLTAGDDTRAWDLTTGQPDEWKVRHLARATAIAVCRDGRQIATAHEDRTLRVWNAATGQPLGIPMEHSSVPHQAAFMLDGQLLLAGTEEGAYLWDPATGTQVGPVLAPASYVQVSPDSATIATAAGRDIRLWRAPAAAVDDVPALRRTIEAATALKLDANRLARPLDPDSWRQRRTIPPANDRRP